MLIDGETLTRRFPLSALALGVHSAGRIEWPKVYAEAMDSVGGWVGPNGDQKYGYRSNAPTPALHVGRNSVGMIESTPGGWFLLTQNHRKGGETPSTCHLLWELSPSFCVSKIVIPPTNEMTSGEHGTHGVTVRV